MIDVAAVAALLPAPAELAHLWGSFAVTHPHLTDCLRRLYGSDAVDRLEAAPAFDDVLARLDAQVSLVGERGPELLVGNGHPLTYERDLAEQARFDAECARDLQGEDE